ncbi:MAG: hypothetical protein GEU81_03140 [Nitriliruptorales bacterium]|nr:hypothetical protein [Nitriliruptorales bacterium]
MPQEPRTLSLRWATRDQAPDGLPGIPTLQVWPEYNTHGETVGALWDRLFDLPDYQSVCWDEETGAVLAEAFVVPCWWDGTEAGLGPGIDATMRDALERIDRGDELNSLCALSAEVAPESRGRGMAADALQQMKRVAHRHGLGALIAPVRPSWKDRYPITPIEHYVTWRRADGTLFDPWMRVHERLGASMGPPLPRSLHITATVAEWESWVDLQFPATGTYTFPRGLAPLDADRQADRAEYWEPNVWFVHDVG